mgnify:CR=1 FL=1
MEITKEKVFEVRCNLDLTQAQFAELLGVSTGTVSQWETGRIKVPVKFYEFLLTYPSLAR